MTNNKLIAAFARVSAFSTRLACSQTPAWRAACRVYTAACREAHLRKPLAERAELDRLHFGE